MLTRIADAAKALGISERFLRQLIAEQRIPFYRLSPRTLRVDLDELRDYMRLIAEGGQRRPRGKTTSDIEQFRDAIRFAGLEPPDVIEAEGKLRRFATNGKRGDDAGWYILHADGIPAGSFGDWRTEVSEGVKGQML